MQSIISQERKWDFVVMNRSNIFLGSIILKLYMNVVIGKYKV